MIRNLYEFLGCQFPCTMEELNHADAVFSRRPSKPEQNIYDRAEETRVARKVFEFLDKNKKMYDDYLTKGQEAHQFVGSGKDLYNRVSSTVDDLIGKFTSVQSPHPRSHSEIHLRTMLPSRPQSAPPPLVRPKSRSLSSPPVSPKPLSSLPTIELTQFVSKPIFFKKKPTGFELDIMAIEIQEEIRDKLLEINNGDKEVVENILKSPGFYAINSGFALAEWIKNIYDAGGSRIEIYAKVNPDGSSISAVVDDGPGFPGGFLKRNVGEKMVNYYDKKLAVNFDFMSTSTPSQGRRFSADTQPNKPTFILSPDGLFFVSDAVDSICRKMTLADNEDEEKAAIEALWKTLNIEKYRETASAPATPEQKEALGDFLPSELLNMGIASPKVFNVGEVSESSTVNQNQFGCDLVLMSSPPTQQSLDELQIKSNAAYILCDNKLFYVNKNKKECNEIELSVEKLNLFKDRMQPTNEVITLNAAQLKEVESITGHAHQSSMTGGGGKGVATVATLMHRTKGQLLVGNVADLDPNMQLSKLNRQSGAVLLFYSEPYSEKMVDAAKEKDAMKRYCKYVAEVKKDNNPEEAAVFHDNSPGEGVPFTLTLPKRREDVETLTEDEIDSKGTTDKYRKAAGLAPLPDNVPENEADDTSAIKLNP